MTVTLTLQEWCPTVIQLPPEVVDHLALEHSHLQISPRPGRDTWQVRPTSTVGTVRVGEHRILIRPKVPLPNLLAMMDVPISSEEISHEVVELAESDDLQLAIVRLLCVAVEGTVRRGIRRDYVRRDERLLAPRGRIDLRELLRRPGMDSPVPCTYEDHTADTPLNRLLKAALVACQRMTGIPPRWRRRLVLLGHELEDVAAVADLEWARGWKPSPMERHYAAAAALSRWVLEARGLAAQHGQSATGAFLLDMNVLFEDLVTRGVRAALPSMDIVGQAHHSLGRDGAVLLKPDILIRQGRRPIAVADCKYKVLDDDLARSQDYYQVLAYATAYGLDEAWLIYAQGPGDKPLREVHVRHTDIRLRTVAVELHRPMPELQAAIERISRRMVEPRRMAVPQTFGAGPR